ncbi:hypothetical protein Rcae01_06484 [Novipirellula caenicola]|uniref:Flagellar assembly factor FliW n=1 Tax=Novipirellula caenicola TaxID=1536901 RepID=A0ABP9W0R5_9BACT
MATNSSTSLSPTSNTLSAAASFRLVTVSLPGIVSVIVLPVLRISVLDFDGEIVIGLEILIAPDSDPLSLRPISMDSAVIVASSALLSTMSPPNVAPSEINWLAWLLRNVVRPLTLEIVPESPIDEAVIRIALSVALAVEIRPELVKSPNPNPS